MPARLIVEAGAATPAIWELADGAEVLVGRNRASHVCLQDRHASRLHARIHQADGHWLLADQGTTNGTRVDGRRVDTVPLKDNQVIAIGEVRLRFRMVRAAEEAHDRPDLVAADLLASSESTHFEADELSALLRFTHSSLAESSPEGLIARALDAVVRHTGASLAGYMSLDADKPELRLVRPVEASLDARLSQHLTQAVLRQGKTVWLGKDGTRPESESLASFRDALCVPLRGASAAWGQDGGLPLGALHAYRSVRPFTDREAKFCEMVAATLATGLEALRGRRALEADLERLRVHAPATDELVGSSFAIARVRELVRRLADGPGPVLLCGETGVGKELVALGLHQQSPRHAGPLVIVNCAAMEGAAAEALLFGAAPEGAARDRTGFFAQADMGTLFLDEVGDLSLDLQSKLVRAIETRRFRPLNARSDSRADVRVIAATRRDLEREMREGRVRPELFFSFSTRIAVPPLRDRLEDIPELAQNFLEHLSREYNRTMALSDSASERLMAYCWPGNVRQLRSVLEAAVANGDCRDTIHAGDLCLLDPLEEPLSELPPSLNLEQLEQWAIRQALRRTNGNVRRAAQMLGCHHSTFYDKLERYGISAEDFRKQEK